MYDFEKTLAEEAEKYTLSAGYFCTPEDAKKIRDASLAAMRRAYEAGHAHAELDHETGH
jgi:hypothetical protein